jgi:pimeloyl-ACP methyl ester carboxylesterase
MRIETLTCPTLVVYGEHSALVAAQEARATAARFQNAQVVEIQGAYHHLMFDRPSVFNRAVLDFFAACNFR